MKYIGLNLSQIKVLWNWTLISLYWQFVFQRVGNWDKMYILLTTWLCSNVNYFLLKSLTLCFVASIFSQDELRRDRLIRKRRELRKADPQKMAALRQKFVDQAKKYYGYPYARKYWPPECKYLWVSTLYFHLVITCQCNQFNLGCIYICIFQDTCPKKKRCARLAVLFAKRWVQINSIYAVPTLLPVFSRH